MSLKKLEQLYLALQPFKDDAYGDLSLHEPDADDDLHYICCDQKIIHCENDVFDISCIIDSHPTFQFATIPEVIEFYHGTWNSMRTWRDFHKDMTSLDIAYNIGLYCDMQYALHNIVITCVNKRLHTIQYKLNDTE
jgi:hypothetical protein